MLKTIRSEIESLSWIVRTLALAAVAGAIYKEMRLPAEERTWHGRLLGFVPYDFRVPTPRKLMRAWWNPDSDEVLSDAVFGVGWSVNVAALGDRLQGLQGKVSSSTKSSSKSRSRGS